VSSTLPKTSAYTAISTAAGAQDCIFWRELVAALAMCFIAVMAASAED
jgi:hypothetical protein